MLAGSPGPVIPPHSLEFKKIHKYENVGDILWLWQWLACSALALNGRADSYRWWPGPGQLGQLTRGGGRLVRAGPRTGQAATHESFTPLGAGELTRARHKLPRVCAKLTRACVKLSRARVKLTKARVKLTKARVKLTRARVKLQLI